MFIGLILLIIANILLGIIPLFLVDITGYSVFALAFTRFIMAFIFELILIIFLIFLEFRNLKNHQNDGETKKSLKFTKLISYHLFSEPKTKNRKVGRGIPQFSYYFLMGFLLVTISIPSYYFGFTAFGVVFTSIAINSITLISITIINSVNKDEEFNTLTGVYILLLLTSIFTVSFGQNESGLISFSYEGLITLILAILSWIGFLILAGKTDYHIDYSTDISKAIFQSKNYYHGIITSMTQLFYSHLFGSLMIYPVTFAMKLFDTGSILNAQANTFLSMSTFELYDLSLHWGIIGTAFIGTLIPYLLIFISASKWPRKALKHDQWNSILTLFEPLIGLYIGFFIWKESIKVDYMIITTILLISSIVIRYFYENYSNMEFYFFISIQRGYSYDVIDFICKFKESDEIKMVSGTKWDMITNFNIRSIERFNQIHNALSDYAPIKFIEFSIVEKPKSQSFLRKKRILNKNRTRRKYLKDIQ